MTKNKDEIYKSAQDTVEPFSFDESVAQVFQDMIERSVPGYKTTLEMISLVTRKFAQPNTKGFDLGSSLGASTFAMRHGINIPGFEIIAIDNSLAMVEHFEKNLLRSPGNIPITSVTDDIRNVPIDNASVVILNFTLQFIPPNERLALLSSISQGMVPGGALILSEKIKFTDSNEAEMQTDLHHSFKRSQGYSTLEIAQKRNALENVLIADTLEEHHNRLKKAGFQKVYTWFQCFSFVSIIGIN